LPDRWQRLSCWIISASFRERRRRERLFTALQSEIEEDRTVLKGLLQLGEVKLKLDDSGSGELRLFEALESLARTAFGR
jgi:hypothetical protein